MRLELEQKNPEKPLFKNLKRFVSLGKLVEGIWSEENNSILSIFIVTFQRAQCDREKYPVVIIRVLTNKMKIWSSNEKNKNYPTINFSINCL